jgi:GAF domain-containing protein
VRECDEASGCPNETLRLESLDHLAIAKALPDPALDRITGYARERFRVGSCLVTLIGADRQLIASGQDRPSDTARKDAFCTHTILRQEVMVVPDAREDARFKENPYVTGEPFIRFYAGAPLRYVPLTSEQEVRLGALCLLDHNPRTLLPE